MNSDGECRACTSLRASRRCGRRHLTQGAATAWRRRRRQRLRRRRRRGRQRGRRHGPRRRRRHPRPVGILAFTALLPPAAVAAPLRLQHGRHVLGRQGGYSRKPGVAHRRTACEAAAAHEKVGGGGMGDGTAARRVRRPRMGGVGERRWGGVGHGYSLAPACQQVLSPAPPRPPPILPFPPGFYGMPDAIPTAVARGGRAPRLSRPLHPCRRRSPPSWPCPSPEWGGWRRRSPPCRRRAAGQEGRRRGPAPARPPPPPPPPPSQPPTLPAAPWAGRAAPPPRPLTPTPPPAAPPTVAAAAAVAALASPTATAQPPRAAVVATHTPPVERVAPCRCRRVARRKGRWRGPAPAHLPPNRPTVLPPPPRAGRAAALSRPPTPAPPRAPSPTVAAVATGAAVNATPADAPPSQAAVMTASTRPAGRAAPSSAAVRPSFNWAGGVAAGLSPDPPSTPCPNGRQRCRPTPRAGRAAAPPRPPRPTPPSAQPPTVAAVAIIAAVAAVATVAATVRRRGRPHPPRGDGGAAVCRRAAVVRQQRRPGTCRKHWRQCRRPRRRRQ